MDAPPALPRAGNKRGEGGALRGEILRAAEGLLAAVASREAVTLRAIARAAGIAAPSIYPHFASRDAILDAIVVEAFDQIAAACGEAGADAPDGIARVEAISAAYVRFAREHPGRYRILFERAPGDIASPPQQYPDGIRAFALLVDAVRDAAVELGTDVDPEADAQMLFAALHGIATLPPALPAFPWRDEMALIRRAVQQATR